MKQPFRFALPEDDLRRDRLAELGQLASGLVHELKNPLGVILLNAELMAEQAPWRPEEAERARKRLARIRDSAENLQAIIQSFLAFAKPTRPDRDAIDVNALLAELLDEQGEALDAAGIRLAFHPDEGLAALPADPQHLRMVFRNVIDNARDALAERAKDRRLWVFTRSGHEMVRVVIANNGPPLPGDVAAHLFEPFHSTKEKGTGLGLAIVKRLVELQRGTVSVSSDQDQGVSFTFEFPTPLGPARSRTQLPLPEVEAVVREDEKRGTRSEERGARRDEAPIPRGPTSARNAKRVRRPR